MVDLALIVVASASPAIGIGDVAGNVFVGLRLGRPVPSVATDFAAVVEVIEQDEPLDHCVKIGRDLPAEDAAGRIAIPLRQIAQHLIVCAVLLHDVHHMLDLPGLQPDSGQRVAATNVSGRQVGQFETRCVCARKLVVGGDREGDQISLQQREGRHLFGASRCGVGMPRVESPGIEHQQPLPSGATATAVGYQPTGM